MSKQGGLVDTFARFGVKSREVSEYTQGRRPIPDSWMIPPLVDLSVAERLVVRRWRSGKSQEQVAAEIGCGAEYVKRMETETTRSCVPLLRYWKAKDV